MSTGPRLHRFELVAFESSSRFNQFMLSSFLFYFIFCPASHGIILLLCSSIVGLCQVASSQLFFKFLHPAASRLPLLLLNSGRCLNSPFSTTFHLYRPVLVCFLSFIDCIFPSCPLPITVISYPKLSRTFVR